MEKHITNNKIQDIKISNDLFSTQKILPPELYDAEIGIELKSEKALTGKQYLLAIPITKFFTKLRNLYLLIHILNGDSIISLRLIEYFVVNYVLDNNTYFNINKYNKNKRYAIENLFTKKKNITSSTTTDNLKEEIREDINSKNYTNTNYTNTNITTITTTKTITTTTLEDNEFMNNFDDLFMIHDNYKCQLKACNKKNFDPFCRSTRIRLYYLKQKYFYTTIAQLNFFKWLIENNIVDYILDNLPTIEKSMNEYEKKIKQEKLLRNQLDVEKDLLSGKEVLEVSEHFDNTNIDSNIITNSVNMPLDFDSSVDLEKYGIDPNTKTPKSNTNILKNSKTKKKELHNSNPDKKTKLKGRKKKEFTKTNRSILRYNCPKVVYFD